MKNCNRSENKRYYLYRVSFKAVLLKKNLNSTNYDAYIHTIPLVSFTSNLYSCFSLGGIQVILIISLKHTYYVFTIWTNINKHKIYSHFHKNWK